MRVLGAGSTFWGKIVLLLCVYCGMAVPALAQVTASISDGAHSTDGTYTINISTSYNCGGAYNSCHFNIDENDVRIKEYSSSNATSQSLTLSRGPGTYTYRASVAFVYRSCSTCTPSATGSGVLKTITVTSKPGNPTITTNPSSVLACETSLAVNWSPGSGYPSGAIKRYDLQESVDGGSTWITRRSNSTATSWPRTVSQNKTYKYRVRGRYVLDGYTSPPTGWVYKTVTIPRCAPGTVTNLSIKQNNPVAENTSVEVNWGPAPSNVGVVARYRARLQKEGESTWVQVCDLAHQDYVSTYSCVYGDSPGEDVQRGKQYLYEVQAYNSVNSGSWTTTEPQYIKYAKPSPPGAAGTPFEQGSDPHDYTVSWDGTGVETTATGAIAFQIRENSGAWVSTGSATSKTYSGKEAATNYTYQVRACNPDNTCGNVFTVGTINIPGQPGAIQVGNIGDFGRDYQLSWAAAPGSVSEHELQQSVNGDTWTDANANVDNATAGTNIRYRVRACNAHACGPYSALRNYWVPQKPALEASIDAEAPALNLSWAAGAHHFRLEKLAGGSWTLVDGNYAETTYSAPATHGTTYRYRVKACNADNACSAPADSGDKTVPPAAPASVAAAQPAPSDSTEVSVSWPRPSGLLNGYYLERKNLTTASAFTRIATLAGAADTEYTDSTAQAGQQYRWRVQPYKTLAGGEEIKGSYSPASSALQVQHPAPSVALDADVGEGATQGTDPGVNYWAGYQGIYTVLWELTGGTPDENGVEMSEQLPGSGEWQPGTASAQSCGGGECNYDKPFNDSGATRIYRYKAAACSPDAHCGNRQITVGVLSYPKPGAPTVFGLSGSASSSGSYTLQWSAPTNTPPNTTGSQAEPVSYYELRRTQPALAQPWQIIHSNTRSQPYTLDQSGGVSGRSYTYSLAACFQPDEPNAERGCSESAAPVTVYVPHAPPTGLAHTTPDPEAGSFTLSWNAPAGDPVHHYLVEETAAGGAVQSYQVATGATSHPFSGKANGQSYSYRIKACSAGGDCGNYSAAHQVAVPHQKPGLPTDLRWTARNDAQGKLTLAWNAPVSGEVAVYTVQQRAAGQADWSPLASTAQLSAEATGLIQGVAYSFRVRACATADEAPISCSAYGPVVTDSLAYQPPNIPGAISHNASEINPASGAFTIHWSAPAAIDSVAAPITDYRLEYSLNGTTWLPAPIGNDGRIAVSDPEPGQPAQATLTGLDGGISYRLRLFACNPDSCSQPTAAHTLYLPRPAPEAPVWLPTNPSTEDQQARRFTVEWQPPESFVHHYALQSYSDGEADWITVADPTQTSAQTFTEREYGRTYLFQVRACSEPGASADFCSAWSQSAPVRLKFPKPGTPAGLEVRDLNKAAGSFRLVWEQLVGWAPEYRYELQENPNSEGWAPLAETVDPVTEHTVGNREMGLYEYRVRACNPAPDNDCGDWSNIATADLHLSVDLEYRYDPLGRLIQVNKDGNAQTGYCHDKADNRKRVVRGEGSGDACNQ